MKIQTEHLLPLLKDEARQKTAQTTDDFEALLNKSLAEENAGELAPASLAGVFPQAPLVLDGEILPTAAQPAEAGLEIASRLEDLLGGLENYARQLAADSPDALRSAHALLADASAGITSLKSAYPDMAIDQPALAGMTNELEILTLNETFKFNRGDYL
jgi:hypothetical protein